MIRQRVRLRTPGAAVLGRLLGVLLGLGLAWFGLMIVLLAVKVAPHAVNAISGYRSLYRHATSLGGGDFGAQVRVLAGVGGLLAFIAFGLVALVQLPRPYLAREPLVLAEGPRGRLDVAPRAVERIVETAAAGHPAVATARGRLDQDRVALRISVARARQTPEALTEARDRGRDALLRHGLETMAVDVTAADHDPATTRELR